MYSKKNKNINKIFFLLMWCIVFYHVTCTYLDNPEKPDEVTLYTPELTYANAVKIVWNKASSENFAAYSFYYGMTPGISDSNTLGTSSIYKNDTSFILTGLLGNTTYYAKVFVYNSSSFNESNEIIFTTEDCSGGDFTNTHEGSMVLIPAGCFIGKDTSQATITRDYYIDTTEVTHVEWNRVMSLIDVDTAVLTQDNWNIIFSIDTSTSLKPKTYISWYQTLLYCNAKSKIEGRDTCIQYTALIIDTIIKRIEEIQGLYCDFIRNGYRLPTEDEWEYAYRAGKWEEYFWGKDGSTQTASPFTATYPVTMEDSLEVGEYAWWSDNNVPAGPKKVAQKKPNSWHLYDPAGNVEEFVWDLFSETRIKSRTDYTGPQKGPQTTNKRMFRGGSYGGIGTNKKPTLTAWWRSNQFSPSIGDARIGFRAVRTAE